MTFDLDVFADAVPDSNHAPDPHSDAAANSHPDLDLCLGLDPDPDDDPHSAADADADACADAVTDQEGARNKIW